MEDMREIVGRKFILKCGTEVVVLPSTCLSRLLICDCNGNIKIVTNYLLQKGGVSWKCFELDKHIKMNQSFLLNCGIPVKIVDYKSRTEIVVSDCYGTTMTTSLSVLKRGTLRWPITSNPHYVKGRRLPTLQDTYLLNCGIEVKLIEYINTSKVTVEDSIGNRKTIPFEHLKSGGVSWAEFGFPARHDGKAPIRVGYKFVNKKKIELEVVEYVSANKVLIKDCKGNSKFVAAAAIFSKSVSWKEFTDLEKIKNPVGNYIYVAKYNSQILYVGRGTNNRYLHCTSGCSTVYELNRLHFIGIKVEVEIIEQGLSLESAKIKEAEYIKTLKPCYNHVFNDYS